MGWFRGIAAVSLGFAMLAAQPALAMADADETDEGWSETSVKPALIRHFLHDVYPCRASAENLLACIQLINGLGAQARPQRALLPKWPADVDTDASSELGPVVLDSYGNFEYVQIDGAIAQPRLLRLALERTRAQRLLTARAAQDALARKIEIPFEAMVDDLLGLIPPDIPQQRAIGTALNQMIQAVDGHGRLAPLKYEMRKLSQADRAIFGIGAEIKNLNGKTFIAHVMAATPAERAGLLRHDILLAIDGKVVDGQPVSQVAAAIRGEKGSTVSLTIQRGEQVLEEPLRIVREKIDLPNLEMRLVDDIDGVKVAWIKLNSFEDDFACAKIQNALHHLEPDVRGLILDLRGNPGGLLEQAICIGGLFVGRRPIVKERYLGKSNRADVLTSGEDKATKLPMVTLIDDGSASASEIVAGALQDYKRSFLLGSRTFGKGSVQESEPFKFQPDLMLFRTIARYYLPSNRTNQIVGVQPDFEVYDNPNPSAEDRFAIYEADEVAMALAPEGEPWVQPRSLEIERLKNDCWSSNKAETKFEQSKGHGDFRVLKAQALLACGVKKKR